MASREPQVLMSGLQGSFVVNTTTEVTKNINSIVVLEDTVFTSIKQSGVDVKSSYIQDPTVAVKAGAIIRPLATTNGEFSGVKLASGSVVLVL